MKASAFPAVAVTGLNATDNPGPGVAVLRCLRKDGMAPATLVGLAYDALEPGIYTRDLVDDVFLLPYPSCSCEQFFDRLQEIHQRAPFDIIIPTLDAEIPMFVEIAPWLRELGVRTLLPTREQLESRAKANLASLARMGDFQTPESILVNAHADLKAVAQQLSYPFFLKGPFYGAERIETHDDAIAAYDKIVVEWGFPVIAQAAVRGPGIEERNVVGLGDGHGSLMAAVAMKKLAVTEKGKGWAGLTIRDPSLVRLAERFVRATHWRGPFELEVVRGADAIDQVIEINPRFPAWVYLAAHAGVNLPKLAVAMAMDPETASVEIRDYGVGKMFIRISIDQLAEISDLEQIVTTGERRRRPTPGE